MEQLLAIWVESLAIEQPDGSTLRDTSALLDALEAMCPFTEVMRLGLFVMPLRGPSRFFGGDEAVLGMVRQCVLDVVGAEVKLGVAGRTVLCGARRAPRSSRASRWQRRVSPCPAPRGAGS